ncbi:MAG: SDR family oxidoreductase [Faecalicoccus sp.]|nr:SDR family oxidoreductase [Faecalicoccus sp.]
MSDGILISGATGFLGTNIIEELLLNTDSKIYVLVRANSMEHAIHRLKGLWYGSKDLYNAIGRRIVPILMDLQNPSGLDLEVKERIQTVIHAAALIQFQMSRDELFAVNVKGTENMVKLAKGLPNLKSFVHVSTAYVSGTNTGVIKEEIQHPDSFSGFYEESKAKAEQLVVSSGLPYIIVRPGMIIGDSKTGKVKNFNTIYYVLKLLLTNKLPIIPTDPHTRLNLVPVDYVAESIIRLMDNPDALNTIFHLTCPESYIPEVKQLAQYAADWANMEKGIEQCHVILEKLGIEREKHFLGTLNAGHPGGMLPLDASQNKTLHHPSLPKNLYVADATILPEAMGNPPILTIMALSKKIAAIIREHDEF